MLNIVMLVCGRYKLTQQSLYSLGDNTLSKYHLTLVVETTDDLVCWTGVPQGQLLVNPNPGCTGAARNAGIEAARERFGSDNLLVCSDNDVWFSPGWDRVLTTAYESAYRYGFRILGGGCHPYLHFNNRASFQFASSGQIYEVQARDAISGYSWLLSWDTWDKYGPLDAHAQGVRQSEDYAMCRKIVDAKYYVGSLMPEVVIHTGLTDTFGQKVPGWEVMARNKVPGVIYE